MNKGIRTCLCTAATLALMAGAVTGCAGNKADLSAPSAGNTADQSDSVGQTNPSSTPLDSADAPAEPTPVTNKLPIQHYPNASYISVKDDPEDKLPSSGTVGDYEYTILNHSDSYTPQKTRGYYIDTTEEPDAPYYFIICSGKKSTGGHDINIVDLGMNGDKLFIVAEETSPAPEDRVTEAFEYPYCVLELDKKPASFEVINTGGYYFPYILEFINNEETAGSIPVDGGYEVPDGYCAVLHGGAGEITYKTYVYYRDNDSRNNPYYEYIHVTSTTTSWGATTWRNEFDTSGAKDTREEIVETAKLHGSGDCMMLPGDYRNVYSIDDFLKMDFIASEGSFT